MNAADTLALAAQLVDAAYVRQGAEALQRRTTAVRSLLAQRRMPVDGWSDDDIEMLLHELAAMDSNNFAGNVGLGEREARIASRLVAARHFRMGHGVGRSGELAAVQPKAAGSSLMARLTEYFAAEALQIAGASKAATAACLVLPLATGLSLTLLFLALRQQRPATAVHVLWPRIDQKSCLKAITAAGLVPVVVPNLRRDDEVCTNIDWIDDYLRTHDPATVLCVCTTTSCFAPRIPDRLVEVAQLCRQYDVPHVTNNAYGVQSSKCMHLISEAGRVGRLDAYVQSTDKNFLVPVGGAILAGPNIALVQAVSKLYPGRASGAPMTDLFITLLSLGSNGYKRLLSERKERFIQLRGVLESVAAKHHLRLLSTTRNDISIGLSLDKFDNGADAKKLSFLGSMLFSRGVSGTRVVTVTDTKSVGDISFKGYMAHVDDYPATYLTSAAALGVTSDEIIVFGERLDKVLAEWIRLQSHVE